MYLGLDISQSAYKRISEKISEIFSDDDFIVNALEEEQEDMLNHLTDERIRMAGFPKEATHENVNYVYRVKSKLSIELWVEMFVNMYDLEGASDFDIEKVVDDDFQVLAVILENFENVELTLEIQEDAESWKAEHKQIGISKEEIVEKIYGSVATDATENFANYMEEHYPQEIRELVQDELSNNGYNPDKVNELVSVGYGASRDGYIVLAGSTANIENVMADVIYKKLADGRYANIDHYLENDEFLEDARKYQGIVIDIDLEIEDNPYEEL